MLIQGRVEAREDLGVLVGDVVFFIALHVEKPLRALLIGEHEKDVRTFASAMVCQPSAFRTDIG
jgi:hypothetical protein